MSRYAFYERSGAPADVIEIATRDVPVPPPGWVLVRIERSAINPSDTKRRSGWASYKPRLARTVLHSDGAGTIVAVGDGVPARRVGERVWLWNAESEGNGTAADHCALPAEQAVPLPARADMDAGACMGVPACTAHRAVFADGSVRGQTILVHGAAGAVARYAIQFAMHGGARVLVTGSTADKRQAGLDLGATEAFDYRDPEAAARILAATGGQGVDRIVEVDLGANLDLDIAVAGLNATIASYSSTRAPSFTFPYYSLAPKGLNLRIVQGFHLPAPARAAAIDAITDALSEGWLKHPPITICTFADIAAAHETAERGDAGKVLLAIGEP